MTALAKPITRKTNTRLGADKGCDRGRRIVLTLLPGNGGSVPDRIELRPEGTRRPESVNVDDVYDWVLKCRTNKANLEKARARKERKKAARERRSIKAAERRLFGKGNQTHE